MSFSHAQGLRDASHRLRDIYAPPTAEEVQLFTQALTTDEPPQAEPEPVRLPPELPIPSLEPPPKLKQALTKRGQPEVKEQQLTPYYPPEEVETRW
ncbi:hypothetical protein [uncultured Thiothrix sp.]|uniref:hypothetical protein n=1 Tax=uncultured Thiothrix sp. TaxID=223185 RepID=UPI002612FECA|nr:hypothetical protein [uncultured Thiothrix sp.]HMT94938.1 hypothetical protein [Thiolinea sp.]